MDIDLIVRVLEKYCESCGRLDEDACLECETQEALNECNSFKKQMESYYEQQLESAEELSLRIEDTANRAYKEGYAIGYAECCGCDQ